MYLNNIQYSTSESRVYPAAALEATYYKTVLNEGISGELRRAMMRDHDLHIWLSLGILLSGFMISYLTYVHEVRLHLVYIRTNHPVVTNIGVPGVIIFREAIGFEIKSDYTILNKIPYVCYVFMASDYIKQKHWVFIHKADWRRFVIYREASNQRDLGLPFSYCSSIWHTTRLPNAVFLKNRVTSRHQI